MKDITKELLEIAEHDLNAAKNNLKIGDYAVACFYSQQAVEKYLKAFLVEKGVFNPKKHKTHNLKILLEDCIKIDNDLRELEKYPLGEISLYSIITRYNISAIKNITEEDAKEAIEIAEKVREFILKKLNI